jgi:hypothetical protein
MRQWQALFVVAVVAAGFCAGYLSRIWHSAKTSSSIVPTMSATLQVPNPSGYDQSLVLPPPSPNDKGEMLDIPTDDIRKHFHEIAGLKPIDEPPLEGPMLPEPLLLPPELERLEMPPVVIPVSNKRERVVRLPAPDDEPKASPTVLRVLHRQLGMWLYTNNRDVRLNFDVTKRGPSGIKAVELWGRRNAQMPYECVDRMEGDRPPFATRLWSEGNYEFRLVFVSGTGVKSPAPVIEDVPDIFVCLDTTPTLVEMLPPRSDPEQPGALMIRWNAIDANLDDNPIRLEFSTDGDSWKPIADDWLPNSGQYSWKVPTGLPNELHLRVRARDKAGNFGESRPASKFPVDLVVPEGRISGFTEGLVEPREARVIHGEEPERLTGIREDVEDERELLPIPREGSR